MASKQTTTPRLHQTSKVKRKGIHAKTKHSTTKHNKNYSKISRGQG
jgi:hypothetical protein